MIALADIAVVTKTDLVLQAEKEVFREKISTVSPGIDIVENQCDSRLAGMLIPTQAVISTPEITDAKTDPSPGTPRAGSLHGLCRKTGDSVAEPLRGCQGPRQHDAYIQGVLNMVFTPPNRNCGACGFPGAMNLLTW